MGKKKRKSKSRSISVRLSPKQDARVEESQMEEQTVFLDRERVLRTQLDCFLGQWTRNLFEGYVDYHCPDGTGLSRGLCIQTKPNSSVLSSPWISVLLYARLGFNSNFGSRWDWKSARVKPPTDLRGHAQMSRLFFIYSYMEIRQHWRLLCGLTLPKPSVSIYVILIQDPGFPLFPTLCSCS